MYKKIMKESNLKMLVCMWNIWGCFSTLKHLYNLAVYVHEIYQLSMHDIMFHLHKGGL